MKNTKANPKSTYTFRGFLRSNPDLVERKYGVDETLLVGSVLNRYLQQRVFVATADLYPDLTETIESMKKIQARMSKEKKSKSHAPPPPLPQCLVIPKSIPNQIM